MTESESGRLRSLLRQLAEKLGGQEPDDAQEMRIADLMERNEFDGDAEVPAWLLDLLSSVNNRDITGVWVDYERGEGDDSNLYNLIRELNEALPIEYENNEESWLLTFPQLQVEACISWEGACYKVSRIGETWEFEEEQ
ncbi:hypothetical protein FE782_08865 [Paenibacillus antri]|uniref:Uncharacterized protein n=1 Tax=Paenibacillus antri TaxID=2582848 RepID=A0A5R9GCC1_9BACL|nr:hypothetical protein [Paenibacillus antri]TLS52729.1 hypothetical protein FE782_08865 [Paenibacillus antri]